MTLVEGSIPSRNDFCRTEHICYNCTLFFFFSFFWYLKFTDLKSANLYKYFFQRVQPVYDRQVECYISEAFHPQKRAISRPKGKIIHILKKIYIMTDNHPLSFVLLRSFSISSTHSKFKNTRIENTFCIS